MGAAEVVPAPDGRQTPAEAALAELLVEALQLDVAAEDIDPDAKLFTEGLGLDSIDALELALVVSRVYGVDLKSDDQDSRSLASLRTLSAHIQASIATAAER